MLDLKFIRKNVDLVQKAIQQKRIALDLNQLLELDRLALEKRREIETLEMERNAIAKQVPSAAAADRPELIKKGKAVGQKLEELRPDLVQKEEALKALCLLVPNLPSPDAPVGKDDTENVEIRTWGIIKTPEKVLDHVAILEKHQWAEFERVAKVCGTRSYALKGEMAKMELVLLQYAMEKLSDKGFTRLNVPAMARDFAFSNTGHFPTGRDQAYFLPEDDLYLTGTAEVVLNSLYSGEILTEAQLPIKLAAFSPCFRREAGSAGRDTRGLMRVHQFMKIEQFIICKNDLAESTHWHQQLIQYSEEILRELELPYRVVDVCTGDMGAGKVRQYDLEAWVPSEKKYRETHSCSTLSDWQARRTNLRYRNAEGKMEFCHTLNNTAIATPRILIPILENHQQPDGSIFLPAVLRDYFKGQEFLGKPLN